MSGEPNFHLRSGNVAPRWRPPPPTGTSSGRDHYYLEIQNHGLPEEERIRQLMPEVARQTGCPIVATNDCHFLDREHHEAHDILMALQTGKTINDPSRWRSNTPEVYFKSTAEMLALFRDWPEAVANTLRIADQVDFKLELGKLLLPAFPLPEGFATRRRLPGAPGARGPAAPLPAAITPELEERLAYELGVIRADRLRGLLPDRLGLHRRRAAHERAGGPGPRLGRRQPGLLQHGHHRHRPDPPPAAVRALPEPRARLDAGHRRRLLLRGARPQIIEYVAQQVRARERLADHHLRHHGGARGDQGRGARAGLLASPRADRISKLVPEELGITLQKAIEEAPGLKEVERESPEHAKLLRNALVLEGLNRNPGIHAAGVLITPTPLVEHVPLYRSTKGDITIQFDMKMSEELGLLKMDFLGLRTLTVIDKALDLVAETTGRRLTAGGDPDRRRRHLPAAAGGPHRRHLPARERRHAGAGAQAEADRLRTTSRPSTRCSGRARWAPDMDEVFVERKHGRQKRQLQGTRSSSRSCATPTA